MVVLWSVVVLLLVVLLPVVGLVVWPVVLWLARSGGFSSVVLSLRSTRGGPPAVAGPCELAVLWLTSLVVKRASLAKSLGPSRWVLRALLLLGWLPSSRLMSA